MQTKINKLLKANTKDQEYKCQRCGDNWTEQNLASLCCFKKQTIESAFIQDFKEHIESTKTNHYSGGKVQVIDLVESLGMLESCAVSNTIKYIARYPKTKNKKDLLKAVHYISMIYEKGE